MEVMTAHEAKKVGVNPDEPYHFITNPTRTELEERERRWEESAQENKRRKLTASQEEHWRKAVELIRGGHCKTYADLGSRFIKSQWNGKDWGQPYSATWAALLVRKLVIRSVFTKKEIDRLIPDRSNPFKRKAKKQQQLTQSADEAQKETT